MKSVFASAIAIACLTLAPRARADWVSAVSRAEPAVVYIAATDGLDLKVGTGFFIDAAGSILTCNHVVAGADGRPLPYVRATLRGDGPRDVLLEVVRSDPARDLALLRPLEPGFRAPATLSFAERLPDVAQDVIAIGHPTDGARWSATGGRISAHIEPSARNPARTVQTDVALNPGNSGGPIIDARGVVVAISRAVTLTAKGQRAVGLNRAIAAADAAVWLEANGVPVGRGTAIPDDSDPAPASPLPPNHSMTVRELQRFADDLRGNAERFEKERPALPAPGSP